MRIAVLADIHGNLPAFEAALAHVAQQGVDLTVIAGDIINGAPDSDLCWQLATSLGCPLLRGNHERYIFDFGTPRGDPLWQTEQYGAVQWTVAQLSAHERQAMAELPLCYRPPGTQDLLIVHASARSDQDSIKPYTSAPDVAAMFPSVSETTIVRGHNHLNFMRHIHGTPSGQNTLLISVGSVGMPLDGNPMAQYSLLEQRGDGWHNLPQAVPYDVEAAVQRFLQTDYLAVAGPIGRLFLREVATATLHLIPFLRLYRRWVAEAQSTEETPTLAAAIDRFLTLY